MKVCVLDVDIRQHKTKGLGSLKFNCKRQECSAHLNNEKKIYMCSEWRKSCVTFFCKLYSTVQYNMQPTKNKCNNTKNV